MALALDCFIYATKAIPFKDDSNKVQRTEPHLPLDQWLGWLVDRSAADAVTVSTAAVLLRRLLGWHPRITAGRGGHARLGLAALLIAHKFHYDEVYTNKSWVKIAGSSFVSLPELNAMEAEFLRLLGYSVVVSAADIEAVRSETLAATWGTTHVQTSCSKQQQSEPAKEVYSPPEWSRVPTFEAQNDNELCNDAHDAHDSPAATRARSDSTMSTDEAGCSSASSAPERPCGAAVPPPVTMAMEVDSPASWAC